MSVSVCSQPCRLARLAALRCVIHILLIKYIDVSFSNWRSHELFPDRRRQVVVVVEYSHLFGRIETKQLSANHFCFDLFRLLQRGRGCGGGGAGGLGALFLSLLRFVHLRNLPREATTNIRTRRRRSAQRRPLQEHHFQRRRALALFPCSTLPRRYRCRRECCGTKISLAARAALIAQ